MSRIRSRRSVADKSLTTFVSFVAIALGPMAASAMSLGPGSVHIGPPPMSHLSSPYVNSLGGGLNNHVDYLGGHGGTLQPTGFAECYRRAMIRLRKLDPGGGYEFQSATARHLCGA